MFRTTTYARELLRANPGVPFTVREIAAAIVQANPTEWAERLRAHPDRTKEKSQQLLISEVHSARMNLVRMNPDIVEITNRPIRLMWVED